jgi:hypothetical protein
LRALLLDPPQSRRGSVGASVARPA